MSKNSSLLKGLILPLFVFTGFSGIWAQPGHRMKMSLNESWLFTKDAYDVSNASNNKQVNWQNVQLPHTWNDKDVVDDVPGYFRGTGWYKKVIELNDSLKGKELGLYFEGANQYTEVFINGKKAGKHTGGYTGFYIALNNTVRFDDNGNRNEIVVRVDNSENNNIPPLSADFTFYGGIYRDVWLVAASTVSFSQEKGADAFYISTPAVSAAKADIRFNGRISNRTAAARKIKLQIRIFTPDHKAVDLVDKKMTLAPGKDQSFTETLKDFSEPLLWSPSQPALYTVVASIVDAVSGEQLDGLSSPLAFRWFRFDAEKGFFLNDKPCKLVGASRHQDYSGLGNAVPDELARQDVRLLKKMGGNYLRVAHYPQDPSILEECDRLGILASVEIPLVNEITESDTFYSNCLDMQQEMILQNFNHPSVIVWCHMNEILLRPHFTNDKPRQKVYYSNIAALAARMDSTARAMDPQRATMIANHADFDRYHNAGLTKIPDIVGWNIYSGWYGGVMDDFGSFLDRHHKELPQKPVVVSEYGADADPRIHSILPVKFDKSVEYTTSFHHSYMKQIMQRPFVAAAMVWNLADFNSESRSETMPHINNKGLLTLSRVPKDPYYLYQALLVKEPFIKILGGSWNKRTGMINHPGEGCYQPVQVASNLDSVTLFVNGKSMGKVAAKDGLTSWSVAFADGNNSFVAEGIKDGRTYTDHLGIDFVVLPYEIGDPKNPFREVNILLGASRYFVDETRALTWIPDQPYRKGSWGFIGGTRFKATGNSRLPYGTDKNIQATYQDPIYQTQQTGIERYKLDVPDGKYEITLHFAELVGGTTKGLVYNLSDGDQVEDAVQRVFTVSVNNTTVLDNFNITKQYGNATAVSKKVLVTVNGGKGIEISFKPIKGEAILNALQVVKLD